MEQIIQFYLSSGISASRRIENTGIIELEGASNIVYSGMGYTPNWQKTQYGTNYGNVEKNEFSNKTN